MAASGTPVVEISKKQRVWFAFRVTPLQWWRSLSALVSSLGPARVTRDPPSCISRLQFVVPSGPMSLRKPDTRVMRTLKRMMLVGCAALLATSCTSPVQVRTPLPADVGNPRPPQPELPEPLAAFVGVWAGRWDSFVNRKGAGAVGVDITLIVENIMPETGNSYRAYVLYSWGRSSLDKQARPGFVRTSGIIGQDRVLRIGPSQNGAVMSFTVAEDRRTVQGEYRGLATAVDTVSFTLSGILWRTTLP